MKRLSLVLGLCLALSSIGWAQSVKLPDKVTGQPGQFIQIPAATDCAVVKWFTVDKGLNVFPVQLLKDTKTAVVSGPVGTYRLYAYAAKGDVASDPVLCTIIIGTPDPTPPSPGPTPPTPGPAAKLIGIEGISVLMVANKDANGVIGTKDQKSFMTSATVRTYLDSKCSKDPASQEWKAYRQLQATTDMSGDAKAWQDAMARPRSTTAPWIIISNPKGSYEGPIPETYDAAFALLKKYVEQ